MTRDAAMPILENYRTEAELADYTTVVGLPGAPVEQQATALVNRGFRLGLLGRIDEAIADCTRVIEMPEVPVEQLAKALVHRGMRLGAKRRLEAANADFTRVINLPSESVTLALLTAPSCLGGY